MRVLLINPSYPFEEFPRLLVTLPYVAAALRSEGHEVEILDLLLARTTPDKIERRMQRFEPECVGITSVTLNHHIAESIAEVVRKCDERVPIVMGGPHVSFEIEGSFQRLPALDYIAIGEGEHTMRELVRSLEGRMDVRDVKGLAGIDRSTGRAWKNAPRPLEDDLDTLPNPARELVPLARYLAFDSHASVVTSRGCPYECIFCSAPAWTGRKVRYRNPSLCVDEIEGLSRAGFTEITIEDDLFTLYRKHFLAVCGELIDRQTGIRWNAFSRVDTITPEIVGTMAKAGCQAICFGVESGNQEVLDLIKKNSNLAKVKEAMRMAQDAGICALASFIVGLPGETEETLRKTVEFAEELKHEFGSLYGFHILSPFPGTEVREKAAEYGLEILNSDWTKYDANHVVSRTPGASPEAIQAISDKYEDTIERYVEYQDHLFKTNQLSGYELKTFLRRKRQTLLWKLLLDEVIESIPACPGDGIGELKRHVVEATGSPAEFVSGEIDRVLDLGALVGDATPEGTRFRWGGMSERLRADAVVIGSGAGGAPVALALAEAGREVVVLEAGERVETREFAGDEGALTSRLMTAATAPDGGLEVYAGACVGGSTVVNDALCWRPPPEILAAWRSEHGLMGLSDEAFAPHVERVWSAIHASPTERENRNRNSRLLERGAAKLGWAGEAMHRNVRGCANLGQCNTGCPSGAKQSALVTWIPDAEARGARVVSLARAERIDVEAGRVRAVDAVRLDAARTPIGRLRIEAPLVCVAAGVLGTPALLLKSGLAGDTALGRGIQFHSSVYVTGRFPEPVFGFFGPTMSYAVTEWSDVHGRRGPGYMLESVTTAPATTASGLPGFGAAHEQAMQALTHLARIVVVLRDRTRGAITLDGDGALQLSYDPVREDLARLRDAIAACARLQLAAGATEVFLPVNGMAPIRTEADLAALDGRRFDARSLSLLYAVHLFGGAAMASSPREGFCDETGRAFGVAGLYVSDASSLPSNTGANPQVTVQANALRIAAGMR